MTQKIYKSARGKTVDMGALMLQNEQVRAVGNMDVNARGDRIDALGNIIDSKNRQIQRQIQRQTEAAAQEHRNEVEAQKNIQKPQQVVASTPAAPIAPTVTDLIPGLDTAPPKVEEATEATAGLAGALVRAKKNKEPKSTTTPTEE